MPRKLHTWKLKSREIRLGERTLIVGVLNVTPDSFSDGGVYEDPDRAFARAIELEELGADIIDIGAESTRPGSARISAAEEIRRLIPVLKRLKGELRIPISVDTYKAEVAELAIEHGAEIINDPSGFTWDPLIAKVIVQSDAGLILNHMRGTPETWGKLGPMPDVMASIQKDLDASISRARRSGVDRLKIVIDPGLGFGKRKEQNAEILARLADLSKLEFPMLVGPSHKSFLAQGTDRETVFATAAAVTASVLAGAHMVRVHDVAEMRSVVAVADEILRAVPEVVVVEPPRKTQGQTTSIPFKPPAPRLSPRLERPRQDPPPPIVMPVAESPIVEAAGTEEAGVSDESILPPIDESEFEDVKIIGAPIVGELDADNTDVDEEDVEELEATAPPITPERSAPKAERSDSSRTERIYTPKPDSKRPYPSRSNDSRSGLPRSGPPRFGSRNSGSERSYPPRSGPLRSDSQRSDGPRASGPRSDSRGSYPPRSGPPRSDSRGGSYPPRSGPPRSDSRSSYPPRSDSGRPDGVRSDSRGSYPPRSGPPRSGLPNPDGPRSFPPRSGPPRSGPPRSGPPRSGPPRSGPPRSGPPRSGPPRSGSGRGPFKGGR